MTKRSSPASRHILHGNNRAVTVKEHGIKVLSSNYSLYGDISRRIVDAIAQFSPLIEVHSIDENFVDLSVSTIVMNP